MELFINGYVIFKSYESYFNTWSTDLCWLILHNVHNEQSQLILKNLPISKKHNQTSINLNNVFDFIDWFLN